MGEFPWKQYKEAHQVTPHMAKVFEHPCSLDDNQHMDTSHVSSKHVKETPTQGLSLSGVDWGGLNKETPKHGLRIMEVDCSGKFETNHTSGCMLSEVDWEAHGTSLFLYRRTLTMMESQRNSSPHHSGRTTTNNIFHPSHGVPGRFFRYWTNLRWTS